MDKFGAIAAITAGFTLIAAFGITTIETAPEYALVFVNPEAEQYIAPPCLDERRYDLGFDVVTTIGDARERGYAPESGCRAAAGFHARPRSIARDLVWPGPSRWNQDGTMWTWRSSMHMRVYCAASCHGGTTAVSWISTTTLT